MKCPKCGCENPDTVEFCVHCGMRATQDDAARSMTPDEDLRTKGSVPQLGMIQYHEEPFYTEWTGYTHRLSLEQLRSAAMATTVGLTALALFLIIMAFLVENLYFRVFAVGFSIVLIVMIVGGWQRLRSVENRLYGKSARRK